MEYEIDELTDAFWAIQDPIDCGANHSPVWLWPALSANQPGMWLAPQSIGSWIAQNASVSSSISYSMARLLSQVRTPCRQ